MVAINRKAWTRLDFDPKPKTNIGNRNVGYFFYKPNGFIISNIIGKTLNCFNMSGKDFGSQEHYPQYF